MSTSTTAFPLCWPIGWPRTTSRQHATQMKGLTFSKARERLGTELERLKADSVTLSTNMPLRFDGQPRADGRPDDPGVAVYFTLRGKAMCMARDAYCTVEQNMNSLAIAIEHLRGLERHGGAAMTERAFSGFAALPDPNRTKTWREVLGYDASSDGFTASELRTRYRELAMKYHPDHGGTNDAMAELNRAWNEAQNEIGTA